MELKTKIQAEDGKQEIWITREFDLPLSLLFRAYTEAEIIEQWMGNKVLLLENRKYGAYRFEVSDNNGNVLLSSGGVIHEYKPEESIIRTFEMENTPFPVHMEYLEFKSLDEDRSMLNMHVVYKSVAHRDQILQLPFAKGINMAHNRLQEIIKNIQ